METVYFEDYGELDWLEPEDFWRDSWGIVETIRDSYSEEYDIVFRDGEYRYTNI